MPDPSKKFIQFEPAAADQNRFLIHSRVGIASILGTLREEGSLVTAYFGGGSDFILTSIVAVRSEENQMIMDFGADDAANQRVLRAEKVTFAATHERINIQFATAPLRQVRFEGRDSFSMPLPAELLRLQRREYFRIATPLTRPLKCIIPPQNASLDTPAEVNIFDISCGGIAIIDTSALTGIETDVRLRDCRVLLPEIGTVATDIRIKSIFEVTLKNGAKNKRARCEFVDMKERERALIQRYVNKVERERRERTGGR